MKKCPNCKADLMSDSAATCAFCGYSFDSKAASSGDTPTDEDDLDFVVYEAHEGKRDFVGEDHSTDTPNREDDLGIETTANLMEQEASNNSETGGFHSMNEPTSQQPIGQSEPPPPPPAYQDQFQSSTTPSGDPAKAQEEPPALDTGAIRRLSDEELKTIERNLYGSKTYVSEKEKSALIDKLEDIEPVPFGNAPIVPPKKTAKEAAQDTPAPQEAKANPSQGSGVPPEPKREVSPKADLPAPQMAKKGRGIAYFYKNYIELRGAGSLFPDDEIIVNSRAFILRPKRISRGYLMGGAIGAFIILLAVAASFFISDTTGYGEIVGVVLDSNNSPYIEGATVRFPDLGKSVKTNSQGFFKADHVPTGSHKLEYIVGNNIVKVDYATVADNEVSTVSLSPGAPEEAQANSTQKTKPIVTASAPPEERQAEATPPPKPSPQPRVKENKTEHTTRTKSTTSTKTASRKRPGDIKLAANVEGAKFEVDGSVMGAGNLDYQNIKPGVHNYVVSLEGYHPVKGSLSLTSGESKTLQVTLTPMKTAEKQTKMKKDDFYYSGVNALKNEDYQTAVKDLSRYIADKPSSADAFFHRAEARHKLLQVQKAHDDFVHAAELYQVKGNFNEAITAYNRAIDIDGKSVTAYLGRAAAYMNKGEDLAAIGDYDKVVYLDRRNFQAYFGLGEARYREGQYKQAIEQFKNARSVDDHNALVYQYLTLSYLGADDYKNVKKSYDKFMEYASKEQKGRFANDSKYATVVKIVQMH